MAAVVQAYPSILERSAEDLQLSVSAVPGQVEFLGVSRALVQPQK